MSERFSAEYIELCRELALPREWTQDDLYVVAAGGTCVNRVCLDHPWGLPAFWVPVEGDWLDLLEAAWTPGSRWRSMEVQTAPASDEHDDDCWCAMTPPEEFGEYLTTYGPDRLTALANLYKAVVSK